MDIYLAKGAKMTEIKIKLTDTQLKSLEYCCYSVEEWCNSAIYNRARIAKDDIIEKLISHCNANSIAISVGEDAQVKQAYDLKVVDTAKNVNDAMEEE